MQVAIKNIIIGNRHRQDLWDISQLADSIKASGLLHPIVLRPDMTLVVGQRRLAACESLGMTSIEASIGDNFSDFAKALQAEADENTCRKALEPVEAVTIGMAIEELVKPKAEERLRVAGKEGGKKAGRGRTNSPRANCPAPKQPEQLRTAAVAAAGVGMKRRSYEKAKAVMKSGQRLA